MLGLPRLQLNFNKITQFINRHDRLTGMVGYVDLCDFLTSLLASVCQVKTDFNVVAVFPDRQILIGKRRVAQAVAKWEAYSQLLGIVVAVTHQNSFTIDFMSAILAKGRIGWIVSQSLRERFGKLA